MVTGFCHQGKLKGPSSNPGVTLVFLFRPMWHSNSVYERWKTLYMRDENKKLSICIYLIWHDMGFSLFFSFLSNLGCIIQDKKLKLYN
jgi:hypothetical protein